MKRRTADEALLDDLPWGYDVTIHFNNGQPSKQFHKQGTLSDVERWARLKSNHKSHTIGDPYTRKQWVQCFGDGREVM
jgi:hypothetical protein